MKKFLIIAILLLIFLPTSAFALGEKFQLATEKVEKKEPLFSKAKDVVVNDKYKAPILFMENTVVNNWKFMEDDKIAHAFVPRFDSVIQHLDGRFSPPRFLDYNKEAAELYKVSGAAINAYTYKSMVERNKLERQLDTEWDAWRLRKEYYLKSPK